MWAATSASLNGIIGGHAYSLTHAITLSNGQNLIRMRNPWGNSEWTGAWSDADIVATKSAFITELAFVSKNDGDFFITPEDFLTHFTSFGYNHDPRTKFQSYWMALGNANTIGVAGTSGYCGSTCKKTLFNITSSVAQTIYVVPAVHSERQYVESPCTQGGYGVVNWHVATAPWHTMLWDEGHTYLKPYSILAGQTV